MLMIEEYEGELSHLRALAQKIHYLDEYKMTIDKWKESELYGEVLSAGTQWYDDFFSGRSKDEQIKELQAEVEQLRSSLSVGNGSDGQELLESPKDYSGS